MEAMAGVRDSCPIRQVAYWFARAVIKKDRTLGGLPNRNLSPRSSGGWTFKIKMLAGLVSSEDLSPGLAEGWHLPVSAHGLSSMCLRPNFLLL